jgi:hypothetical protein
MRDGAQSEGGEIEVKSKKQNEKEIIKKETYHCKESPKPSRI